MSDGKPVPQNIQDAFLNTLRREKTTVTVYLLNGAKLIGKIKSFDKFSAIGVGFTRAINLQACHHIHHLAREGSSRCG